MKLSTETILRLNQINEAHYIQEEGQPERTILFQHITPKHKAGKRGWCFSTASTARKVHYSLIKHILTKHKAAREWYLQCNYFHKKIINSIKSMKNITTKHKVDKSWKGFSVQIATNKKLKAESNQRSTIHPRTRPARKNIYFSTHNTQAQGWQERMMFF